MDLSLSDATTDPPEDGAGALEGQDYDPWERFNERMFAFNYTLDRRVVKPAATGWSKVVPESLRKSLQNAVRNLGMPRRFVNNLFQLKVDGALRELAGFVLNSTLGIAGLGDVAGAEGIAPPDEEDTGQTLAVYGVKPGPYLVLPFFPPSTVRDTIGAGVDGLLDPLSLVMPLVGSCRQAGRHHGQRPIDEPGVVRGGRGERLGPLQRHEEPLPAAARASHSEVTG
jgi:phospholipid-binding lipoprotein MlaA